MAKYEESSPWKNTPNNETGEYLDFMRPRPVPASPDDVLYEIEPQYNYRPDLLAYDLYGTPKLWWVFAQRNPDYIEDPIYDFAPGVTIRLPKLSNLKTDLGL